MGKKLSIVLVLLVLATFMLGGTASAGPGRSGSYRRSDE